MQTNTIPANSKEYDVAKYDADEEAGEDPRWREQERATRWLTDAKSPASRVAPEATVNILVAYTPIKQIIDQASPLYE